MEFNVTREQWVERFVMRMSQLRAGAEPAQFIALAHSVWATRGHTAPEDVAVDEARAFAQDDSGFADTHSGLVDESPFEKTQRIPVERIQAEGGYVRDNAEWIERCVTRVLALDPLIRTDEARRSVTDLALLERWRLMNPEAAAEQLYTPIKPRVG